MRKRGAVGIIIAILLFSGITFVLCIAAIHLKKEDDVREIQENREEIQKEQEEIQKEQEKEQKNKEEVKNNQQEASKDNKNMENQEEAGENKNNNKEDMLENGTVPNTDTTPTATAVPSVIVSPAIKQETENNKKGSEKIIAIDAGHQEKGNFEKEPIGPGASEQKAKVASGTTGVSTKVAEYILTLDVSLKLRDELKNRGYTVVMIRETHDVNMSNRERAEIANKTADIFIRIHANGSDDSSVSGALTIYPSESNPYVANLSKACKSLSSAVIDEFCKATEAKNRGAVAMDNMSGINWCTIPVTILEMGFMSNEEEDKKMQEESYQEKMVQGIANGIDVYFKDLDET